MLQLADKCCVQVPVCGGLFIASWVCVSKRLRCSWYTTGMSHLKRGSN